MMLKEVNEGLYGLSHQSSEPKSPYIKF